MYQRLVRVNCHIFLTYKKLGIGTVSISSTFLIIFWSKYSLLEVSVQLTSMGMEIGIPDDCIKEHDNGHISNDLPRGDEGISM